MSARLYGVSLGLGRVRPKLRVCCFPRLSRPPRPSKLRLTEQSLRRIVEIAPQGVFHTPWGDFGDKKRKIKENLRRGAGSFLRFLQDSSSFGVFAISPENRSLKYL